MRNRYDKMDELMEQYRKKFGEYFPLMCVCLTDEELEKTIKSCIQDNRPFETDDEVIY